MPCAAIAAKSDLDRVAAAGTAARRRSGANVP